MSRLYRSWPFVMALLAAGMLAAAHAFETFGRMSPCELCLKERQVWWAVLALGLAGGALSAWRPRLSAAACGILGLALLGGAVLAGYHAGAEWKFWPGPQSCSGTGGVVSAADMARLIKGGPIGIVRCDQPAWVFLGLSMAGWNALISLVAGLASLSVAARRRTA